MLAAAAEEPPAKDSDFPPDVAEVQSAGLTESSALFDKFDKGTITTAVYESKGGNLLTPWS